MNKNDYDTWLQQLADVWNSTDSAGVAPLFSDTASYNTDPFAPALHGREAIVAYWQHELANHRDVNCTIELLERGNDWALAHWRTSLIHRNSDQAAELDGVILVRFNQRGECVSLREWWMAKQNKEHRT